MPRSGKKHPLLQSGGFSLVLSLTVMAMLLLLCLGAATLLAIELRVARASVSYSKARLNAMVGARIAFGEVQRLLGPDQRVSATAEVLCDPQQTDPTKPAYYTNSLNGVVVHPHWVGVWNSGRVTDASSVVPGAASGEETKVIQRTSDGCLMDSRFANGGDWAKSRASKTPAGVSKRFAGWLVSGNEAVAAADSNAFTPFTAVAAPGSRSKDPFGRTGDVALVGPGSLGTVLPSPSNRTDGDYLGVRASQVGIPTGASPASGSGYAGSFAYWVSDEGVKARINLADKFENITPNAGQMDSGGMARLLVPQRAGFAPVQNPLDTGGKVQWTNFDAVARAGAGWSGADSFGDIALLNPSADANAVENYYFHDITFDSSGVFCDTLNGGLRKDLSAYFNFKAIADSPAVPGSGIADATPLLSDATLNVISPKLGLLYNWYTNCSLPATALSETATSPVITAVAPDALSMNYNINAGWYGTAQYTLGTPDYANPSNTAPLSPVVTRFDIYYMVIFTPANSPLSRDVIYPRIDLWNPYSVPIQVQNTQVAWASPWNLGGQSYLQYNSCRPLRQYSLSNTGTPGTVTLTPGQSITFVPQLTPLQDISSYATNGGATLPPPIKMVPGTTPTYYIDLVVGNGGYAMPAYDPTHGVAYFWQFGTESIPTTYFTAASAGYSEFGTATATSIGPFNQVFLLGGAPGKNPAVLQQVNFDPWCLLTPSDPYYGKIYVGAASFNTPIWSITDVESGTARPTPDTHLGFRLACVDDSTTTDASSSPRNTNCNPFVNYNFRTPRHSRHPFDAAALTRVNNCVSTFALTTDNTIDYESSALWPRVATQASPYLSYANALNGGTATQFAILDVPRQSLGLQSLGQLQSAPLVLTPWAPGIPFGNAFTPIQAQGVPDLSARSGYTKSEEDTIWGKVSTTAGFNNAIRQQNTGAFPWTGNYDLSTQRTLIDWSYELNYALWDGWMISGISSKNTGWTNPTWDLASLNPSAGAALNSRLADTGVPRVGNYFAGDNFKAYRTAYTLMQKGAFNVNSTSVVAWEALLGAFRGLVNPTRDGKTNAANQTPFSRNLIPATGPIPSSVTSYNDSTAHDQATWSGFRALDDNELRALAGKIVAQVKQRGPFLSLSDFVNRRLIPDGTGSYGSLTTNEDNFLGTIQAAINEAGLNNSLDATAGNLLYLDRSNPEVPGGGGQLSNPKSATVNPATKAKDKLAGTPGYLLQSDVLQKIGPVLSARSDTFKIRARGESDDGAEAYVELTVQRSVTPIIPDTSGAGLPINPKAISAASNPTAAGNQFFGRRMQLVRTRWLGPDEI